MTKKNLHGDFIWYELMTPDPDACARFYGDVLGWQARAAEAAGPVDYRILSIRSADVAGMASTIGCDPSSGMKPAWVGYVAVDDVDACANAVVADGGRLLMPPTDIAGVGRMAMMTDPQGIPSYLMRGESDEPSPAFAMDRPGHCSWNELSTPDPQAALAFYRARFGWEPGDAIDMGERGDYRFLTQHGAVIGALMQRHPDDPPPGWTFYFCVTDIERAADAIQAGGGTVCHGPAEVPGGSRIVVANDPAGASFGLVAPPPTP